MPFRLAAWITLLATLFSAASPTLAAVLLQNPAALGQMLGVPVTTTLRPDTDELAHHAAHHTERHALPADEDRDTETEPVHAAHGIYCSFCLNPTSVATIAASSVTVAAALYLVSSVKLPELSAQPSAASHPPYRSRAPPSL